MLGWKPYNGKVATEQTCAVEGLLLEQMARVDVPVEFGPEVNLMYCRPRM